MKYDNDNGRLPWPWNEDAWNDERRRKECAYERYLNAVSKETNECTPEHVKIAQRLTELAEGDCEGILGILDKASLPEGATVEIEGGEISRLNVRHPDGKLHECVFDVVRFEDSIMGAWQAFLLHQTWRYLLPLIWHGNRYRRDYVYEKEDIRKLTMGADKHSWMCGRLKAITSRDADAVSFTPELHKANGKYYVSCCYWTDWGGLIREHAELTMREGLLDEFVSFYDETIWPHKCGVIF